MEFRTLRTGCPNRIIINTGEARSHCKALIGQPNGSLCVRENCAAMYIAELLINELRSEVLSLLEELGEKKQYAIQSKKNMVS